MVPIRPRPVAPPPCSRYPGTLRVENTHTHSATAVTHRWNNRADKLADYGRAGGHTQSHTYMYIVPTDLYNAIVAID